MISLFKDFFKPDDNVGFLSDNLINIILEKTTPQKISIKLSEKEIILFQGDSITDCDRKRGKQRFNDFKGLGNGYPKFITEELLEKHPEKDLKLYNRAISGNKAFQLLSRWEEDCLLLKPTLLSILIGVNDYWHYLNGKYSGDIKIFEKDLRLLIMKSLSTLPNLKIVLGEPFALKGVEVVDESWFPEFYNYQKVVKELAIKFNLPFIPYQNILDEATKHQPAKSWTYDG
ncbi:MAG: lysophospholipase, partial [Oligoflexus sp.]|nr:lysophospholipase [Pseudopedobacter sp.]